MFIGGKKRFALNDAKWQGARAAAVNDLWSIPSTLSRRWVCSLSSPYADHGGSLTLSGVSPGALKHPTPRALLRIAARKACLHIGVRVRHHHTITNTLGTGVLA